MKGKLSGVAGVNPGKLPEPMIASNKKSATQPRKTETKNYWG